MKKQLYSHAEIFTNLNKKVIEKEGFLQLTQLLIWIKLSNIYHEGGWRYDQRS
jgi:hypothetical protein